MKNEHKITKLAKARFISHWTKVNDSQLILDFNPLIEAYGLINDFIIVHWQAKPLFFREWGAYDSHSDSYFYFSGNLFSFGNINGTSQRLVDLDESKIFTKPTSCMLINNATLQKVNGIYTATASLLPV